MSANYLKRFPGIWMINICKIKFKYEHKSNKKPKNIKEKLKKTKEIIKI